MIKTLSKEQFEKIILHADMMSRYASVALSNPETRFIETEYIECALIEIQQAFHPEVESLVK